MQLGVGGQRPSVFIPDPADETSVLTVAARVSQEHCMYSRITAAGHAVSQGAGHALISKLRTNVLQAQVARPRRRSKGEQRREDADIDTA